MASDWDLIVTDHYLAQLVFPGPSGLPEDQFVTTYVFRNDNVFDRNGMLNAVDTALSNFWSDPAADPGMKIVSLMPGDIGPPTLRIFDLGQAPPRFPEEKVLSTVDPEGGGQPLPREVAVVCSYHNGGPGPRNRGRFYIGPLTVSALSTVANEGRVEVSDQLRTMIVDRATDMAQNPSLECTWVQYSRRNNETHQVVGGWVDNAFDTQRRRGKAPSSRNTWGDAIAAGNGGYPGGRPGDGTTP